MKRVSYLIVLLISLLFISNVNADHISKYAPSFKPEKGILNNNVAIFIGVEGESVTNTSFTFSYDNRYLEYKGIEPLNDNDEIKITKVSEDGKWSTYKFNADVEYSNDYFGILMFKTKNNFKDGSSTDIFFYNYEGKNDESKFRHNGSLLILNRNSNNELVYQEQLIDTGIQIKYWILEHLLLLIAICGTIILLIALFLLMPLITRRGKKKENLETKNMVVETVNGSLGLYNKFEGNVVVNNKQEDDQKIEDEIEMPKKIEASGHETKNGLYVFNEDFDDQDEK